MLSENCPASCSTSIMLQSYTEMQGDDPNMKIHLLESKHIQRVWTKYQVWIRKGGMTHRKVNISRNTYNISRYKLNDIAFVIMPKMQYLHRRIRECTSVTVPGKGQAPTVDPWYSVGQRRSSPLNCDGAVVFHWAALTYWPSMATD